MPTTAKKPGFTFVELLVAVIISSILVGITVSIYSLFRKSMNLDQAKVDITQNARIAFDRLSRELRQTPEVVTEYPSDPNDNSVTQPGEIEFEDGHAADLTYRRYYVSGGILRVQVKEYYFAYDDDVRVEWNAIGNGGVSAVSRVISTNDIADRVQGLELYGSNEVQLILTTTDSANQQFKLRTTILGRNL